MINQQVGLKYLLCVDLGVLNCAELGPGVNMLDLPGVWFRLVLWPGVWILLDLGPRGRVRRASLVEGESSDLLDPRLLVLQYVKLTEL